MKKSIKTTLGIATLGLATILISSCTTSFCSELDKARMMYPYEQGITRYCDSSSESFTDPNDSNIVLTPVSVGDGFDNLYKTVSLHYSTKLTWIVEDQAVGSSYDVPSIEYWEQIDLHVLNAALNKFNEPLPESGKKAKADVTAEFATNTLLKHYGYLKFFGAYSTSSVWENWNNWTIELKQSLGLENVPNSDFQNLYISKMNASISSARACIATQEGDYGAYGDNDADKTSVYIQSKDWSYAWSKGFIEGLLVYPVAYLVDSFAIGFGFSGTNASALPQIWAIILVTLIVRGFLMIVSFKSTLGQQKMTLLQPELAKIQQKYPNSNTNSAEKQRLAQEQMALYKKNKINPLSSILIMIVQFPIFIAVWGAMTGSAVLSSGSLLGLRLSDSIGTILIGYIANGGFTANVGGWWTAVILFILMAGFQFLSMKLPTFIQKFKSKNVTKTSKNPAQDKQAKTMKWMSNIMLVFIIIMGFSLPSAMGVYWLIGAIISIIQTVIVQLVMSYTMKKKKYSK